MATLTLQAPLPAADLPGGVTIKFEAISPTTGAAVSGVTIANAAVTAIQTNVPDDAIDPAGPFMLVPGPTREPAA